MPLTLTNRFALLTFEISTIENQAESPFLRLSPEIRNKIYTLAITSATILVYDAGIVSTVNHSASALRATCKQICFETKPFMNTFSIAIIPAFKRNAVKALRRALRTQREERDCSMIKELRVTLETLTEDESLSSSKKLRAFTMEAQGFPALKRVTVCCSRTLRGVSERSPRGTATKPLSETPEWVSGNIGF